MRNRSGRVIRTVVAARCRLRQLRARERVFFYWQGVGYRTCAGCAFLQQQFGRGYDRVIMKAFPHDAIQNGVCHGKNGHALMVRHVSLHNGHFLPIRHAFWGVIQSFVKTVSTVCACFFQNRQIGHSFLRINHRGQQGGIGRHHSILPKATFQTQPWNAKVGVLIGVIYIPHIIG